ncbi:MAG TPA: tRNA guanosine(34) transglycosylase Tgt [Spirochaetia bacterium]|nr:tRNA guanosine(34) transglycosylase Tgt [Spirochaetia bacterium]
MSFTVSRTDPGCRARTGSLALNHGTVVTPCFMPVGTNATVKAMQNRDLEDIGVNLILGNTYHLYLRPGRDVIGKAGGLHSFMGWRHNILTDSGGYQVFSLSAFRKVEDDGVLFKSHIDGSSHHLTPEDVLDIQTVLGSDVMMPLDECTSPGIDRAQAAEAVRRTTAWLGKTSRRWRDTRGPMTGQLFGIMQGNFYADLRVQSAEQIVEMDLPGYAIGGLSVGEEFPVFRDFLHSSASLLPDAKPKYLMGIGTPRYILEAVEAGIDLFDCVFPTRTARNAQVFTREGPLALRNEKYKLDFRPIDEECGCRTCRHHTRAYLRHLFKAREIQAAVLATCHNLAFLQGLVMSIRESIAKGDFLRFKADFLSRTGGE